MVSGAKQRTRTVKHKAKGVASRDQVEAKIKEVQDRAKPKLAIS